MSSKPLPTKSLLELIDLFEQSGQPIADGDGQRLRGVPAWSVLGQTSLTPKQLEQWADCVGYAGTYPAPLDDDRVHVDLMEDDQPDRYRYRCPETFRWKFVPAAVPTQQVNEQIRDMTASTQPGNSLMKTILARHLAN